jgi:hypothetical protein
MIRSERQSEPFVRHPKIAVATECDRLGSYRSDFPGNHPDVGLLAAVVREAVLAETIVEPAQQYDIVLQPDIRPALTTATPAAAESSEGPLRSKETIQPLPVRHHKQTCQGPSACLKSVLRIHPRGFARTGAQRRRWRVGRPAESLAAQMWRQEKVMEM